MDGQHSKQVCFMVSPWMELPWLPNHLCDYFFMCMARYSVKRCLIKFKSFFKLLNQVNNSLLLGGTSYMNAGWSNNVSSLQHFGGCISEVLSFNRLRLIFPLTRTACKISRASVQHQPCLPLAIVILDVSARILNCFVWAVKIIFFDTILTHLDNTFVMGAVVVLRHNHLRIFNLGQCFFEFRFDVAFVSICW